MSTDDVRLEDANDACARDWQEAFAVIFAVRDRCDLAHGSRVANLLFGSLSMLSPMSAVATVLADRVLYAAVRTDVATMDESPRRSSSIDARSI